jgi:Mg-chelatase subunit ChlD
MKMPVTATAVLLLTAGVVLAYPLLQSTAPSLARPADPRATATAVDAPLRQRPKMEVVFVLDTTGSMGGMIQAAKENIWSIASSMAQAKPTPELSIGLVAFRDRGDEYVTRVIDLSTDLDSVYAQLMDFEAAGGGDHPEAVNQALHEAVHRIGWSQQPNAYRSIFLVGDAPPKSYADEMQYPEILQAATIRGIVINSVQAGQDAATHEHWTRIAQIGGGAYFQVAQSGGAVAVSTPFDARIAELSRELDGTRMFYGDRARQAAMAAKSDAAEKLHVAASPAAQAKRASFNATEAGRTNLLGDSELIDAVSSGRVRLEEIAADHLPPSVAALPAEAREAHVAVAAARRQEITAEIDRLAQERQAHISATVATDAHGESLDHQLFETVKAQAAAKGLSYEGAPVH